MYLEFHVASSRGLSSGSRDLLAQVGGWDNLLGKSDAIVLQVDDLQLIADDGVVVDHLTDRANQLDNLLGHMVTGCGL